jgi:phage repressor protein C with HTH and peptisase S24 domain
MFAFPWRIYKISGHSMRPNLEPNDLVLVRLTKTLKSNDVGIFRFNGNILVKRVKQKTDAGYELVGDNPYDSWDSNAFGLVDQTLIIGKVIWH